MLDGAERKLAEMTINYRNMLVEIGQFEQLIAFLRDQMDWPIASEDFEELTFEYSAEELGIDGASAAKIQEIRRLRPLAPNQPWGVFFVKFEPKRLPVVALRSILGRVALKKRASANRSELPAWEMEDLLFVSNYGEGQARQISFAHFAASAVSSRLPTLKVIAWDRSDTALHLDQVARELTDRLAWPDDENDADAWREQWRSAFTLGYREAITTAQQLSIRLAELARATRDRVHGALEIESESGRVTRLMKAFAETLMHDLHADDFADMVAQTISYGLLSARITDPQKSTGGDLAGHMRTNSLLRDLMITFLEESDDGHRTEIDFDELGVGEVIELLDHANLDAVLRDFGDRNPREDPVIHFYESFLSEYDKKKKVERGVFYTPRPVVSYIIRSIDHFLRTTFGLTDGLADITSWREMAGRHDRLLIPKGISPDQDFIQILDPATGTGTFLVEAIDLIHRTLVDKWKAQGHRDIDITELWNDYVPKHLLPRLHGFELMMAPYAIAHLKIGLKLYETGYRFTSDERAQVYLTNSLEPAHDYSGLLDLAIPALAHEVEAVNHVKENLRFTVIIGNPPYSGHSANKGQWIADLIGDYKKDVPGLNKPAQAKWLSDDYVKFIRFAQSVIERTGTGALGYISNHSYLDNPTFRGMRRSLMRSFDDIHLLDLHGNAKKQERTPDGGKDENVFDIQQGVAIGLFLRPPDHTDSARVLHSDLWGRRDRGLIGGKYGWLSTNVMDSARASGTSISAKAPQHLFVPRDEVLADEYEAAWPLSRIFSPNGDPAPGIVTTHDQFAISWTHDNAAAKVELLLSTRTENEARQHWRLCSQKQWQYDRAKRELANDTWRNKIETILYRPFDLRATVFDRNVAVHRRERVMHHMLAGPNLGLITCRQQSQVGVAWSLCSVSQVIIESSAISNKTREVNYLFPLYTYPTREQEHLGLCREPNIDSSIVETIGSSLGLEFIADGSGNLQSSFGPDDLFNYICAVLHSPAYRRRYADFLRADFPRIPLASSRSLFSGLVLLGKRLAGIHLLALEVNGTASFPAVGDNRVHRVRYAPPEAGRPGRVFIGPKQYFNDVEPEVWGFNIGSYRPAEKWLRDRRGRVLSGEDIDHYLKIVAALTEIMRLMAEVDEVIELHGGWSGAFE